MIPNTGSTARDFLATERNFLTQCRFGVLLSLLSSSFMLQARIPTSDQKHQPPTPEPARKPFGYLYFLSGLCVIFLALCYYAISGKRLAARRAFLRVTKLHTTTVTIGVCLVFTTCIALLVDDGL